MYNITIFQDQPTQFDNPLFKAVKKRNKINLTFAFYKTFDTSKIFDPEMDRYINYTENFDQLNSTFLSGNLLKKLILLNKYFKNNKVDLAFFSPINKFFTIFGCLLARFYRIPVLSRSDPILKFDRPLMKILKKLLLPILYLLPSGASYGGKLSKEYLNYYLIFNKNLFFFPYCIDNDVFTKKTQKLRESTPQIKESLGIDKDCLIFLSIIKFVEREGVDILLEGFNITRQKHPNICLLLVGDGPLRNQIENYIESNNVDNCILTGFRPYSELPKFYTIADVFIHPGRAEAWGVSVNEAAACKLPIITSDYVGSHSDLIIQGKSGYVFKSEYSKDLSKAMEFFVTNKDQLKEMGEVSYQLVGKYSPDSVAKYLEFAAESLS